MINLSARLGLSGIVGISLLVCLSSAVSGCKKNAIKVDDSSAVFLTNADLSPDGSLNESGKQKLADRAGDASLIVRISRCKISDKSLEQFAGYPNIKTLDARGSALSDGAIEKLKKALPEITVNK